MTSNAFIVNFNEGTLDVLAHCESLIQEANQWVHGPDWMSDMELDLATADLQQHFDHLVGAVAEMRLSLYQCLGRVISLAGSVGGAEIYTDGLDSFFWRTRTGFHGGLIFFAMKHGDERLPVGKWEIHT